MSTQQRTRFARSFAALATICAAVFSTGCKSAEDERPPPTPAPTSAPAPATAAAVDNAEIAARKFELSSSAKALQAKATEAGEGDLARACAALDAASKKDCEAVKLAAPDLKKAKSGLRGDAPHMLGDAIARTERAVEALCP